MEELAKVLEGGADVDLKAGDVSGMSVCACVCLSVYVSVYVCVCECVSA